MAQAKRYGKPIHCEVSNSIADFRTLIPWGRRHPFNVGRLEWVYYGAVFEIKK
jgi:hypothetical protein